MQLSTVDGQSLGLPTQSLEAYDYFLRGRKLSRRSRIGPATAANHFERAPARPKFHGPTLRWVAHTDAFWFLAICDQTSEMARKAIDRALGSSRINRPRKRARELLLARQAGLPGRAR